MTPLPAPPATPAAQPPSLYQPTKRDETLAAIADNYHRTVFDVGDSAALLPKMKQEIH